MNIFFFLDKDPRTCAEYHCDICPSKKEFLEYSKPTDIISDVAYYCQVNDITPWCKWFLAVTDDEKKSSALEMVDLLNRSLTRVNGERDARWLSISIWIYYQ